MEISKSKGCDLVRDIINQIQDGRKEISIPEYCIKNEHDPLGIKNVNFSSDLAFNDRDDRKKRWEKQRLKHGFDDTELWNLDYTILKFIAPRLREFAKDPCGYPPDITYEEWKEILNKMVFAVDYFLDENNDFGYVKDETGGYKHDEKGELIPTEEQKKADEGWDLFHKYFFHLWN